MDSPELAAQALRDIGLLLCNGLIIVAIVQMDSRWLIPCYLAIGIIIVEQLMRMGIL